MANFKLWFESLQTDKEHKIRGVWDDILKVLVGSVDIKDAANTSLNTITHQGSSPTLNSRATWKGKTATLKKLSPFFDRLAALGPEFAEWSDRTKRWLGKNTEGEPDADIGKLMKMLFGSSEGDNPTEGWYDKLSGEDPTTPDQGKLTKTPAVPPQDGDTQPDAAEQQPPMPPQPPPMPPQPPPMPPQPPQPQPMGQLGF